ncbi:hypothetical protein L195_g007009 [Trifolium pratense]|uniref:Uncharacterized protein n=1 Tax=Trifolium pratense TaxID=57577 RepID=A0A2K3P569_TRIPR|nr:hypothetical protein L195_g007009 [Trifolium pratense]
MNEDLKTAAKNDNFDASNWRGVKLSLLTMSQYIPSFRAMQHVQGALRVSDHFTEMRALWEELDQFRPMP